MNMKDGGREREKFHLLVHSPNSLSGHAELKVKPRTRSYFWISHMGAKNSVI